MLSFWCLFFLLWLPWRFILLLSLPALDAVTDVSTMDLELEVCGIHTGEHGQTDSFVEPGGYMDSFVHVKVCSVHTGGTWTDRQLCRAWELHGFFWTRLCGVNRLKTLRHVFLWGYRFLSVFVVCLFPPVVKMSAGCGWGFLVHRGSSRWRYPWHWGKAVTSGMSEVSGALIYA